MTPIAWVEPSEPDRVVFELDGAENDSQYPDREENHRGSLEEGHCVEGSGMSVHDVSFGRR